MNEQNNYTPGRAETLYKKLEEKRNPFVLRGRECAKLTIPSLFVEEGHNASSELLQPNQSLGAQGVKNLSSKMMLALLPPNSPFFRLAADFDKLQQDKGFDDKAKSAIESALSKVEMVITDDIEASTDRITIGSGMQQLLVVGNVSFVMPKNAPMRMYRLTNFVVKRTWDGDVLHFITKENTSFEALPAELQQLVSQVQPSIANNLSASSNEDEKTIAIYTHFYREKNKWKSYQEIAGAVVPNSLGTYPLETPPFIILRYTKIDGEDYSRSFVEELMGDLTQLDGLSRALNEGSAAAAKGLLMVNPNGVTRKRDVAEAPNWAVITGMADDVSVLQAEKYADFRTVSEQIQVLSERLYAAFLMNSSVQRQAERVTAEEIRFVAKELEEAQGGLYSILSQDLQYVLVNRRIALLKAKGEVPELPKGVVKLKIITGLEALGRGQDLNKLDLFVDKLAVTFGPEVLPQYINVSSYIEMRAAALGLDTKGLIKTPEEVAEEQQAAQQQSMMSQFGPEVIKQAGPLLQKGMEMNQPPAK